MDAAHYLAELARLVSQAEDMPAGSELSDSHGNQWQVHEDDDAEKFLFHSSNEKTVSVRTSSSPFIMFQVQDIEP